MSNVAVAGTRTTTRSFLCSTWNPRITAGEGYADRRSLINSLAVQGVVKW